MSTKTPTVKELLAKTDAQQQEILAAIKAIGTPTSPKSSPSSSVSASPSASPSKSASSSASASPSPSAAPTGDSSKYFQNRTQLNDWVEQNSADPRAAIIKAKIANQPTFIWLNGDEDPSNQNAAIVAKVQNILKQANGAVVGFSLYAIPGRDAGQYSAGGVKDAATYNAYVGAIGYAIQQAGNPRVDIVVETDALGLNLPLAYTCINAAVDILKKNSNTKVFLTASEWVTTSDMASRLKGAGVERADGVAVNISGREIFPDIEIYVKNILSQLKSGLVYLIDTSRNGAKVQDGVWCNTTGQKLGVSPQIFNEKQRYAYAWVKPPAESDGNCNGAPNAGQLWIDGAAQLAS